MALDGKNAKVQGTPEQWKRDNVAREVNAAKQREAGEITVLG